MDMYKRINWLREVPFRDYLDIKKLGLICKVKLYYTMVSYRGLSNIYELAMSAERNKLEGCFVECGVWRGGCAAVMAWVARRFASNRKIWLFDSFKGLPEPTENDGRMAKEASGNRTQGRLKSTNICVASRRDMLRLFSSLKLLSDNIMIEGGWFQDTLPRFKDKIGHITILRIDCDWYESTKCCLENLYENVVSGGYIIIDDYGYWQGCKKATDEFLAKARIDSSLLKRVDGGCYYFQKP